MTWAKTLHFKSFVTDSMLWTHPVSVFLPKTVEGNLCVFSSRSEKQDGHPGLWLAETFSTSPLKPLNGIQRNLKGSKISTSSTKFVIFGQIGKTRWPPWSLIGWDSLTSPLKPLNGISVTWQEARSQSPLLSFCFSGWSEKTRWPPWSLIDWDILTSPLKPLNRIQRNLTGSKISTSYQVCVFWAY